MIIALNKIKKSSLISFNIHCIFMFYQLTKKMSVKVNLFKPKIQLR